MSILPPEDPVARLLAVAAKNPEGSAVISRDGEISYRRFVELAGQVAATILKDSRSVYATIRLPQGTQAYASMFGVLMAGCCYSPINVTAPELRRRHIERSFDADVLITNSYFSTPDDHSYRAVINIDQMDIAPISAPRPGHHLAYVIFTSGSTGQPKGVMISRSALAHYISWAVPALGLGPKQKVAQHANIGFDLSVVDIYGSLCSGSSLVPVSDPRDRLLPAEFISDFGITVWVSVPSLIDLMRKSGRMTPTNVQSAKVWFFCGEPLFPQHLEAIFAAVPDATVINAYGPTEATVSCTELRLTADDYHSACRKSAALGDPIPGMRLELVGSDIPDQGEIAIFGPQVAEGYWNDEERTRDAFCAPNSRNDGPNGYLTGDWALRQGGQIYFERRIDRQIKIQGFRIELGEIDAALRDVGALQAHTVHHANELVSFVAGLADSEIPGLLSRLSERLPRYAIPGRVHILDQLPRNANDKIDQLALVKLVTDMEQGKNG
jgi:D-alanine--poly(phosphoribitol) ligase subunit 1